METLSDTIQKIRNTTCIVCGEGFSTPRAGKLFCSSKCKQFSFYHKDTIKALQQSKKGIDNSIVKLSFKEFENYDKTISKVTELNDLFRRQNSKYLDFDNIHEERMNILIKALPDYLRTMKLQRLSIEEWSFFKVLYPQLGKEDFFKIISSFGYSFLERLRGTEHSKFKNDIVRNEFESHLRKIVEGKILFI